MNLTWLGDNKNSLNISVWGARGEDEIGKSGKGWIMQDSVGWSKESGFYSSCNQRLLKTFSRKVILFDLFFQKTLLASLRKLQRKQQDQLWGIIKPNDEVGLNYSLVSDDGEDKLLIDQGM